MLLQKYYIVQVFENNMTHPPVVQFNCNNKFETKQLLFKITQTSGFEYIRILEHTVTLDMSTNKITTANRTIEEDL